MELRPGGVARPRGIRFTRGEAELFFWSLVLLATGVLALLKTSQSAQPREIARAVVAPPEPAPVKPRAKPAAKRPKAEDDYIVDLTGEDGASPVRRRSRRAGRRGARAEQEVILE